MYLSSDSPHVHFSGSQSLSSSRSLRELYAHSRNEMKKYTFSDNGFPEVNSSDEISKDKAQMLKE